jgi:signal transduction histidine kinase
MKSETDSVPAEAVVVLRPDGVVDAVGGGAPVSWLGHRLDDAPGVPAGVRDAAADLLARSSRSGYVRREKAVTEGAAIEIILVEALPIRRSHTRIRELVMRTMDLFMSQAHSSNTELSVEWAEDVPPTLFVDSEKVAWALSTLVGSALRFVQQRETNPRVTIRVGWDDKSSELVVVVSDNGPGMPEARARWLFERDPSTGKTAGLALLMVRDVLIWHRGSVSVESRIGRGTTFTMRLPRLDA